MDELTYKVVENALFLELNRLNLFLEGDDFDVLSKASEVAALRAYITDFRSLNPVHD